MELKIPDLKIDRELKRPFGKNLTITLGGNSINRSKNHGIKKEIPKIRSKKNV